MTLVLGSSRSIASPTLAPTEESCERAGDGELNIALVNNMPDSALKSTERQFMRLIEEAAGKRRIRFRCFSLPSVSRSQPAKRHIEKEYGEVADLRRMHVDGLIVTGAEPITKDLRDERYWHDLAALIDWAATHTRSTIWSCLAAHAAVLHLDGIQRRRLDHKCSGVYDCVKAAEDWLPRGLASSLKVPHSRFNALDENDLVALGYRVLTRSEIAGVDIFVREQQSRFIFLQGHPEYDASSLQREYMRDLARYLSGERDDYPAIPVGYFDESSVKQLTHLETRARRRRDPLLAAELPGLMLRNDIAPGETAKGIFTNWLAFLGENARSERRMVLRK